MEIERRLYIEKNSKQFTKNLTQKKRQKLGGYIEKNEVTFLPLFF